MVDAHGDKIVEVEGFGTKGVTLNETVKKLKGEVTPPPDPPAGDQEIVFTDFRFFAPDGVSAVEPDGPPGVPGAPAGRLDPVAPNPFNPATRVRYALDRPGAIALAVYAADGRLVRTLWSGWRGAGDFEAVWDGRDDAGLGMASGVYFARLQADGEQAINKLTLLK